MIEKIVLVDDNGTPIGTAEKLSAHNSHTPLHLAFSCYIFDGQGNFLLTQRAHTKKVWPDVWTNSACGHPTPGESMPAAIARRAKYELGINHLSNLQEVLPDYRYRTPPYKGVIENEVCPVYVAFSEGRLTVNPEEVENYRWLKLSSVVKDIAKNPDKYSYWFKDQLSQLVNNKTFRELSGI